MSDDPPRRSWRRPLAAVGGGVALPTLLCASQLVCLRALPQGVLTNTCPSGDLVKTVMLDAHGLQRGESGGVSVWSKAWYTAGPADIPSVAPARLRGVDLTLVTAGGEEHPLEPDDGWDRSGSRLDARIALPGGIPDGDHTLRVEARTWGETVEESLPLPLYAPARVDVLSDRPLYEPGNELQVRAVTVRGADLVPLGGRPGLWTLTDPEGTVVVERKATADAWGVTAATFALDPEAPTGRWTVRWTTGQDQGEVGVQVEPFTLPRFRVEATPDRRWYGAGDQPLIRGKVVYASGAPVADAALALRWRFEGAWQPPRAWTEGALPATGHTDAAGRFSITAPQIPADLVGTVDVRLDLIATDAAGERVPGAASLRLAEDPIQVEAVSELGDGLVQGFNNRLYLRATTPDGVPLPGTRLRVQRAWDPGDAGVDAETDADGVAALQIDPGPPVSVPLPLLPVRPPPPPQTVTRLSVRAIGAEAGGISLADAASLDGVEAALVRCAELVPQAEAPVSVAVRLDAAGRIEDLVAAEDDLGRCAGAALATVAWAAGGRRTLQATWQLRAPDRPDLSIDLGGAPAVDAPLRAALERAARRARACLPDATRGGDAGLDLEWRTWEEERASVQILRGAERGVLPEGVRSCVAGTLARAADGVRPSSTGIGTGRLRVSAAPSAAPPPAATPEIMDGYALRVLATKDGEDLGATTVRIRPGRIPELRLRMEPVLASPGQSVAMTVLRGPDFSGDLPEKVWLRQPGRDPIEAALDPEDRTASFRLPDDAEGWYVTEVYGARSLVWVAPAATLDLALSTDKTAYAPGETATLTVRTTAGGAGVPASVGLFGVDSTLGQLAPLPGPDALDDLRVAVPTPSPAFGVLDAQGLARGRVRGPNAAAAVLLRVGTLPTPAALDGSVSVHTDGSFDPVPPLVDAFYTVLTELHKQTRAWEAAAPADEQMQPATLARLWGRAQSACADRGEPASDAWGRPLRLHQLPSDLLALTEPRMVVVDGTRLPEDVENWAAYVAEEQP